MMAMTIQSQEWACRRLQRDPAESPDISSILQEAMDISPPRPCREELFWADLASHSR